MEAFREEERSPMFPAAAAAEVRRLKEDEKTAIPLDAQYCAWYNMP